MPTGGSEPNVCAMVMGTPCAVNPAVIVVGSVPDNPMTSSEKNKPMDSALPAVIEVMRMPDAAPRWLAGTEFITTVALGEVNMPDPNPLTNVRTAKIQYGKSTGITINPMKLAAVTRAPMMANVRGPCRSDSQPAAGPAMRKPTVRGIRKIAAQNGALS